MGTHSVCQCGHGVAQHPRKEKCFYCNGCKLFRYCDLLVAPQSLGEKLDRALLLASHEHTEGVIGYVHRPHHLFALGDVVAAVISNGAAERWHTYGWSSKKHANIREYHMLWQRFGNPYDDRGYLRWKKIPQWQHAGIARARLTRYGKRHGLLSKLDAEAYPRYPGVARLIETPGEWAISFTDPAVRSYALEALQQAFAASSGSAG